MLLCIFCCTSLRHCKRTVLSWVPAGSTTRFFHGGQSHRPMRLPYCNSLCTYANDCPKETRGLVTITYPVRTIRWGGSWVIIQKSIQNRQTDHTTWSHILEAKVDAGCWAALWFGAGSGNFPVWHPFHGRNSLPTWGSLGFGSVVNVKLDMWRSMFLICGVKPIWTYPNPKLCPFGMVAHAVVCD